MSFRQDGNEICVKYEQQKLVVKAIRDDIVNIFVPYRTKEHYSKAIDGDKAVATELTAEQKGEDLVIATDKIRMQFGENLEMVITRPDGTPLVRTHRQGRSVCGEVSEQMKQILESEGHDTSNLGAHDYPVQMMFDLDEGDDFYGLGDKTGFLNKKNYEYENWNSDIPQAHNEDYHALYKSIPVLFCKKKNDVYGMFFDNTFHSYLNLGKENPEYYFYGADDGNLDLYFLGGEKLTDLIEEYTYLTGRTPLPPPAGSAAWAIPLFLPLRRLTGSRHLPSSPGTFILTYAEKTVNHAARAQKRRSASGRRESVRMEPGCGAFSGAASMRSTGAFSEAPSGRRRTTSCPTS